MNKEELKEDIRLYYGPVIVFYLIICTAIGICYLLVKPIGITLDFIDSMSVSAEEFLVGFVLLWIITVFGAMFIVVAKGEPGFC